MACLPKSRRTPTQKVFFALALLACTTAACLPAPGQSSEWLTSSGDAARDAWQRSPSKLTLKSVPHLQLLWKTKLESKPMGMLSFREPLIVSGIQTSEGTHTLAIMAGAKNDVHAIDADSGKVLWEVNLKWSSDKPQEPGEGNGFICTNALSATPVVSPADTPESQTLRPLERRLPAHHGLGIRRRTRPAHPGPSVALRQALRP